MDVSCGIILCKPLLNSLVFLFQTVAFQDMGVAIIILTLAIRIILFPVFHRTVKHQMLTQELQPEVKRIQEKHKNNKQKQGEEILALYKKYGTNPLAGIGLIVVQIPILFALFNIFRNILNPKIFDHLYPFIESPGVADKVFLGLINLGETSIIIVGLAAVAQFIQGKLSLARPRGQEPGAAERMGKYMVYVGPGIALIVLFNLPAAISLYWLTSSLFSVGQQVVLNKRLHSDGLESFRKQNNRADGI